MVFHKERWTNMEDNIKCDNCIRYASEAYQRGFNDAMKLYHDEIIKAAQSRPIQYILPKNYRQQRK
jgi:hypothetical protein